MIMTLAFGFRLILLLLVQYSQIDIVSSFVLHPYLSTSSSSTSSSPSSSLPLWLHGCASYTPLIQTRPSTTRKPVVVIRLHNSKNNDSNDDDFKFDPLLSPHCYPQGTNDDHDNENDTDMDTDWSPFKMNSVKDDFKGATPDEYGVEKAIFTRKWSAPADNVVNNNPNSPVQEGDWLDSKSETNINAPSDDSDEETSSSSSSSFFDPLISPHCYPKGTSAGPVLTQSSSSSSLSSKKESKIGILLVDHGSRRTASNTHLEQIAKAYQQRVPPTSNYIIRAAHMEIAEPSIKNGMKNLIEQEGVDIIVCHPYFLSPGRHVIEDIPQLIEEAIHDLKIGQDYDNNNDDENNSHVQVLTTGHVGSSMDRMIDMIQYMVDETLPQEEVRQNSPRSGFGFVEKDSSSLGGFFGNVQKMLDEQL